MHDVDPTKFPSTKFSYTRESEEQEDEPPDELEEVLRSFDEDYEDPRKHNNYWHETRLIDFYIP